MEETTLEKEEEEVGVGTLCCVLEKPRLLRVNNERNECLKSFLKLKV
jgi:hypothetical protein